MKLIGISAFGCLLAAVATAACAQETGLVPSKGDPQEFVVGDSYSVTVERQGHKEQVEGTLVGLADDWIVLVTQTKMVAESNRVPYLGDLPLVGVAFRTTRQKELKAYVWLRRDTVHVDKREAFASAKMREQAKRDKPKMGDFILAHYMHDGKRKQFDIVNTFASEDAALADVSAQLSSKGTPAELLFVESMVEVKPTKARR